MIIIKKLKLLSLLLLPIALIINFISSKNPELTEAYYSLGVNTYIVKILNSISSIFPFSLYEVTMYLIVFSTIFIVFYLVYLLIKKSHSLKSFLGSLALNIGSLLSIAYFLFVILWGLNYNRLPLEETIIAHYNETHNKDITTVETSTEDLVSLYEFLIERANETRELVKVDSSNVMMVNSDEQSVLTRAYEGYKNLEHNFLDNNYDYHIPKAVMSSHFMCYTGITGIYFPFTGEANVNMLNPDMMLPSTTCHEVAHLLGYASEDEANFLGYLASISHPHADFQYSGYILGLRYVANELYSVDYEAYVELSSNISEDVRRDLDNNREFWNGYKGSISEISNDFNDTYLKANGVSEGTVSYSLMVELLLTYYKLYPY